MSASISSNAPLTAPTAQSIQAQKAAIQKLVVQYTQHTKDGTGADVLARLGRAIKTAAASAGVTVNLPAAAAAVASVIHQTEARLGAPISNGGLTSPNTPANIRNDVTTLTTDYRQLAQNGEAAAATTGLIATAQADAKAHGINGTVRNAIDRVVSQAATNASTPKASLNVIG